MKAKKDFGKWNEAIRNIKLLSEEDAALSKVGGELPAVKSSKRGKKKVVISRLINQATTELVGAVWTDIKGRIHFVGLKTTEEGDIVPNLPDMGSVYIADVAQVGITR